MTELAFRRSDSPLIGQKLRRLSILSSVTALLTASLALLYFQLRDVRNGIIHRYGTMADIISFNVAAAVDFNDPEAAKHVLSSLKSRAEVEAAEIVVDNSVFASYQRGENRAPLAPESLREESGYRLTGQDITIFRPVKAGNRKIGTLFIRSSLSEVEATWRRFALITAIVAIPAFLVAIIVCVPFQRTISQPILTLGRLASTVSETRDYSIRAPESRSVAEIEQLVATFNQMLAEIERQHTEIDEAKATLETRVSERTAELAVANAELESFSYSVSHDLRAPLRAIDGFSKALLAEYPAKVLDDRAVHYLERVRAGTKRMSALIDDMLHLARVTRRAIERADVDLSAIATDTVTELSRLDPERQVHFDIEPKLVAWADAHLMSIVFTNLIGNAWKFTSKRPEARIAIGTVPAGHGRAFYVRDNGAGFDMRYADKLFGAFQRLHSESEFDGTGIGLATVRRIINRHGGSVWADAVVGEGATFYFTLGDRG